MDPIKMDVRYRPSLALQIAPTIFSSQSLVSQVLSRYLDLNLAQMISFSVVALAAILVLVSCKSFFSIAVTSLPNFFGILFIFSVLLSTCFHIFFNSPDFSNIVKASLKIMLGISISFLFFRLCRESKFWMNQMFSGWFYALIFQFVILALAELGILNFYTNSNFYQVWTKYRSAGVTFSATMGTMGNPNDLSFFLITATLLALKSDKLGRSLVRLTSVCLVTAYFLVLASSRSSVLLLGVLLSLLILRIFRLYASRGLATTFWLLMISIIVLTIIAKNEIIFGESDYSRLSWSRQGWDLLLSGSLFNFLLGFGPGSSLRTITDIGFTRTDLHNGLLQVAFEYGYISGLAFLLINLWGFTLTIKRLFGNGLKHSLTFEDFVGSFLFFSSALWLISSSNAINAPTYWLIFGVSIGLLKNHYSSPERHRVEILSRER